MNIPPRKRSRAFLTLLITLSLTFMGMGMSTAFASQQSAIPTGAPVDIHSGTCQDIIAEPAFDAGEIEQVNTADVWEDDTFQAGIFNDDQLQATGIDFNNDGQLQEDEVITPNGVDTELGRAQGDLGASVSTTEPYVVAVHASPDAYETIIACGSIDGAPESDGQTVVRLQSAGDSDLFGFAVLTDDNSSMTTYLFTPNTTPIEVSTPLTEELGLMGRPLDMHTGTCQDFTAEPMLDLGDFQQTNAYAPGEQNPGDMEGEIPTEAQDLGPVYKVDADGVDYGETDLANDTEDGPYVVAVHESAENYSTTVACGQVLQVMDDGNTVVFLHPVGGSNEVGYVELNSDDGIAKGYLWQVQNYQQPETVEATPITAGTPAPVVDQTSATPTQEATAVIVETQIVGAATATAIVEGDQSSQMEPVAVDISSDQGTDLTASANQTLALMNNSDNDRTFTVQELDLSATVASGQSTDLLIPETAEAGTYTYQVLEGDNVVYEGNLAIQ